MLHCTAVVILLIAEACTPFPRDPMKTLERATGAVLKVGVTESYPWVIRHGDEPVGVEPDLVRRFAESIDADVEWIWGSPEEHFTALEHWDLHVAITGLTESSPWRKRLGLTRPYFTSRVVVGRPPSDEPVSEIDGLEVLVPERGGYAGWVREHDGVPVPTPKIETADSLTAVDEWELDELHLFPTDVVIHERRHVIATPPGENRFLMALENVLYETEITPLLENAKRYRETKPTIENVEQGDSS